MWKEVVVVVDSNRKEVFKGSNLQVENVSGTSYIGDMAVEGKPHLEIREGDKILAQFQIWMYWRGTE